MFLWARFRAPRVPLQLAQADLIIFHQITSVGAFVVKALVLVMVQISKHRNPRTPITGRTYPEVRNIFFHLDWNLLLHNI